jgi:cell wall-associated NlpC family hydrolase
VPLVAGPVGPAAGTVGAGALIPTPAASMASVSARVVPRVLDFADGAVGTPYVAGGASPSGFDAAGFVQYAFGQQGVTLPRTVGELAGAGMTVPTPTADLRPGDLLFFSNDGTTPDHVAIYAGRDRIVHATASGGGVRYDVLGQGARGAWFSSHLVAVRRIVDGAEDRVPASGDTAPRPAAPTGRGDQAPRPSGVGAP